jgi:hypothetical protein
LSTSLIFLIILFFTSVYMDVESMSTQGQVLVSLVLFLFYRLLDDMVFIDWDNQEPYICK